MPLYENNVITTKHPKENKNPILQPFCQPFNSLQYSNIILYYNTSASKLPSFNSTPTKSFGLRSRMLDIKPPFFLTIAYPLSSTAFGLKLRIKRLKESTLDSCIILRSSKNFKWRPNRPESEDSFSK